MKAFNFFKKNKKLEIPINLEIKDFYAFKKSIWKMGGVYVCSIPAKWIKENFQENSFLNVLCLVGDFIILVPPEKMGIVLNQLKMVVKNE